MLQSSRVFFAISSSTRLSLSYASRSASRKPSQVKKTTRLFHRSGAAYGIGSRKLLDALSEQQMQIASDPSSAIIVAAGPGTGKTVTAAAKVVHMVSKRGIKPEEILVLTQGERCARQIQHLVDINTSMRANSATISSVSSFSGMLLDDYGVTGSSIPWLKEDPLVALVEENRHLFTLNKYDPDKRHDLRWRDLLDHFSKLDSFGVTPEAYNRLVSTLVNQASHSQANSTVLAGKTDKEKELMLQYRVEYASSHKEIADAYTVFTQLKEKTGKFGISDRLPHVVRLISQESVRSQLLGRYKHIIVDQIEDWARQEWDVLEALAFSRRKPTDRSYTFFGDDDLGIMEWAGAPKDAFPKLKQLLPQAKLMPLTTNFRCNTAVLTAARSLISKNSGRFEQVAGVHKSMVSYQEAPVSLETPTKSISKSKGTTTEAASTPVPSLESSSQHGIPPVYHVEYATESDEIHGISELLGKLLQSSSAAASSSGSKIKQPSGESSTSHHQASVGIITRFRSDAANLCKQLQTIGAPVPSPLTEHTEVKFLFNILKVVLEPSDAHALYDLLCSGMFSIPGSSLAKITEMHQRSKLSLRAVLSQYLEQILAASEVKTVSKEDQRLLKRAKKLLALLTLLDSKLGTHSMRQLVYITLKETRVLSSHRNPNSETEEEQSDNIARFVTLVEDTETKLQNDRPSFVWPTLKRVCLNTPTGADLEDNPGVIPVRTAWASKGYEYDYVIIPHFSDDRFPGRVKRYELQELLNQASGVHHREVDHLAQMRRVLYTAMTRARKGVIFTYHTKPAHGKRPLKISRFVPEALGVPSSKYLPDRRGASFGEPKSPILGTGPVSTSPGDPHLHLGLAGTFAPNQDPSKTVSALAGSSGSVTPPRASTSSAGSRSKKESPLFGGGIFTLQSYNALPELSIRALHVFMRCPLQFYQQFIINVAVPVTPLAIFQEAIGAVLHAISTQQVDNNNLSSFDKLRKLFDKTWESYGVNPVRNPEMYEQGMSLSETLLDSEEGLQDLIISNSPWKLSVSLPVSPITSTSRSTVVESQSTPKTQNDPNSVQFADSFQRVYSGHHVRHYLTYSESAPPETVALQNLAKIIAWAYYKHHRKTPSTVIIEYVTTRFQMKMLQFSPTPQLMLEAESYLNTLTQQLLLGKFEAQASSANCKRCPFSNTCPSSAAASR